jgi:hypothetical protein
MIRGPRRGTDRRSDALTRHIERFGLLAGMDVFAIGGVSGWLAPAFAPEIPGLYEKPPFRPWPPSTIYPTILHAFWLGLAFAKLFTSIEPRMRVFLVEARFGVVLFRAGALHVSFLIYALIAISWQATLCWLVRGFSQSVLVGAALGARRIVTSHDPIRRSVRASIGSPRESSGQTAT